MVERGDHGDRDSPEPAPLSGEGSFELDADRHLAELESLHGVVRHSLRAGACELYRRTSCTLRVRRTQVDSTRTQVDSTVDRTQVDSTRTQVDSATESIQVGRDDGLALRVVDGEGRAVFCATSGAGEPEVAWLVERSRSSHPGPLRHSDPWDRGEPFRLDRERSLRLPAPAEVRSWLREAAERLGTHAEAWVEVATTVESWVAGEGLRASRSRVRAWAFARPPHGDAASAPPAPLIVANRRWEDLPIDGWAGLAADRIGAAPPATTRLPSRCAVLFAPEPAAILVQALVRVLHVDPGAEGRPVGPGWRLADDPTSPGALFGGGFDDARFPTARRELADGRQITGSTAGPGCYRRPSFRDPPAPMPAHVVVEPGPEALPRQGVLVSGLQVHPLGPESWVLTFDGAVLERGAPGARIPDGRIIVAPGDLVERCVGAYGDPVAFRQGVRTPALLFDDLSPVLG